MGRLPCVGLRWLMIGLKDIGLNNRKERIYANDEMTIVLPRILHPPRRSRVVSQR